VAVTLIVEDGTGKSDANALVSLDAAKEYWDSRGTSYSSYSDDQLNGAIVRASAFLTNAFVWGGLKVHGRDQTMAWPRVNMIDREGWVVPSTEVPREVTAACAEIALYEAETPGAMNPNVVLAEKVRSEQVGSIRVEYANLFTSASDARPTLTVIQDLLAPFLSSGGGSALSGKTVRG
jgi:hypothetical protein